MKDGAAAKHIDPDEVKELKKRFLSLKEHL